MPVLVEADVWEDAAEALDDVFLGDAEVRWLVPALEI